MAKKIKIYLHSENQKKPKLVEIDEDSQIKDIAEENVETSIIEGDAQSAIKAHLEDEDEIQDKEDTVKDSKIKDKGHIHCHRCSDIKVTFSYNGTLMEESFKPSATAKRILKVAADLLGIDPKDAVDLVLRIGSDKGEELQDRDHIGSFAKYPECSIKLFTTAVVNIQG